jgi:hypothetical protein
VPALPGGNAQLASQNELSPYIAGAGKAGVWTKADSLTLFEDFTYTTLVK